MDKLKVIRVGSEGITFDNGILLSSEHESDCCEHHELTFTDLTINDFKDLEFNLTNDNFFKRVEDYGIELVPIKGHSIKIPGHGYNNGYYGTNIDLLLTNTNGTEFKRYDITECQNIEG